MKRVLVTVDWDFFVPENPMHDMQHCETEFHLSVLWKTRYGLRNEIKTNGLQKEFWKKLGLPPIREIYVSDSHVDALPLTRKHSIDLVINYDQHHDCWPLKGDKVGCDNWLTGFLRGRWCQAVWVRPPVGMFNDSDDMDVKAKGKLVVKDYGEPLGHLYAIEPDDDVILHVCRSGCWTPPWLDLDFIEFVKASGAIEVETLRPAPWDGMTVRWSAEDFAEADEGHRQMQKMVERYGGVLI